MILHKEWGKELRMGNYLFKYASILGLSKRYDTKVIFPKHYMFDMFKNKVDINNFVNFDLELEEQNFFYDIDYFDYFKEDFKNKKVNLTSATFLQSFKYWQDSKEYVHNMLSFKEELVESVKSKYSEVFKKPTIGISIRRGNFINHPVFYQTPIEFYLYSLETYFPNWEEYNLVFFCDDSDWVRKNFIGDNVFYADGNFINTDFMNDPSEQLILGSLCDNFIISNSTFSWWLGYLAVDCKNTNGKVIHTGKNFRGFMEEKFKKEDFYPQSWIESDFLTKKINIHNLKTKKIFKG